MDRTLLFILIFTHICLLFLSLKRQTEHIQLMHQQSVVCCCVLPMALATNSTMLFLCKVWQEELSFIHSDLAWRLYRTPLHSHALNDCLYTVVDGLCLLISFFTFMCIMIFFFCWCLFLKDSAVSDFARFALRTNLCYLYFSAPNMCNFYSIVQATTVRRQTIYKKMF